LRPIIANFSEDVLTLIQWRTGLNSLEWEASICVAHKNEYLKHLNQNLVFISADIQNFALFTNLT
jgi:hypothetical protein